MLLHCFARIKIYTLALVDRRAVVPSDARLLTIMNPLFDIILLIDYSYRSSIKQQAGTDTQAIQTIGVSNESNLTTTSIFDTIRRVPFERGSILTQFRPS